MNVEAHIAALLKKHRGLEEEIKQETMRNPGNYTRITALKREKLRIKDEISRLKSNPAASAPPDATDKK